MNADLDSQPLTILQVAQQLGAPQSTVQQLIADGELIAFQYGATARTIRVEQSEVDDFKRRHRINPEGG